MVYRSDHTITGMYRSDHTITGMYRSDHTSYCRGARGISCRVESVDEGEAMAAAEAISWAEELSMDTVQIEGDSSNIISFLNYKKETKDMDWRAANILTKLRGTNVSRNQLCYLKVSRVANNSADSIAKIAKLLANQVTWSENTLPSFLFDVISTDCKNAMGSHPIE